MNSTRRTFVIGSAGLAGSASVPGLASAAKTDRIVVAIGEEPSTVDPSASWTGVDYQIAENYGEFLIQRLPNGDLKPGLASSWNLSPDGKLLELTLRRGVRFHSGDPFTSRDVLFSYERGRAKSSTVRTRLASVERIEAPDPHVVRIHFKAPDVTFIPNRAGAMIVSKAHFDKVGEARFGKEPVGTGPYRFVRHANGESLDLERFDGYWGSKPPIAQARFVFVPEDTTRVAKLKAGEVDLINACPYSAVKELDARPEFKLVRHPVDHPTMSIVFASQNPKVPWHDRRVRLAMAHAVNAEVIASKVLGGIPNRWPFLAPHELGYDAALKHHAFDPGRAAALLAQAGHPTGFEFKLYYASTGRVQMNAQVAETTAAYLEAVGIRARLVGEEWLAYRARYNAARNPDAEYVALFTHGRAGSPDPTYNLSLFFAKDGAISLYANPEIDRLIAQAKATVDDARRAELIRQQVRLIHEDVPSFPIYNNVAVYAMKRNVSFRPTAKFNLDLTLVKDMAFL